MLNQFSPNLVGSLAKKNILTWAVNTKLFQLEDEFKKQPTLHTFTGNISFLRHV